ncbi:MAG: response regulator transcription factor, partial [Planctomycetia bacterium]|nr:response regulator transcription factor [Planctomycetia bacterium]
MPESQVPFRVLVIEDDESTRSATAGALREHMHTVFEAADGAAGLEIATTETLDAIVLDLMLPRMDGITLLEKLRQRSAIPVIITSAKQTENDRVNLLDLGADDYLTKPFTVRELLARLRAIVRRIEGDTTSVITIGDLAIDCHAKKVARGGEPIPLTAMEFEVLAILAKHKGRIVSRALLEK